MDDRERNSESRKQAIRKQLNIAKYTKPENIVFSDENDHNPLVLEKCPVCKGTGKNCKRIKTTNEMVIVTDSCEACGGLRVTGNLVRQYSEDSSIEEARVNRDGWLKCPGCGTRFTTNSAASWSGWRHKTCGQKIRLVPQDA